MIAAAEIVVLVAEVYLAIGLVFAIVFAWRGAAAIDPAAKDGTLGFRLLIVPASALLWPLLARRWWRGGPPPLERNAHRDAARRGEAAPPAARRQAGEASSPGATRSGGRT